MDLNSQNASTTETPQATLVLMGESWAAGVSPVSVSPRSRRVRWGVAGAIVLIVALVTAGGVFVLSGAAGQKSLTAGVAPKNTIAFLEVRMDLPGDQRSKLADFMSHFPGFQDRALFNTALDQLLNRLVSAAGLGVNYTSDLKPWMQGEFSLAEMNMGSYAPGSVSIPMMGGATPTPAGPVSYASWPGYTPPSAVAIFALKDRTAAETWVASQVGRLHVTMTGQSYAGTTIYATSGANVGAYAFTDQDLFVGTVPGVEAALDTKTQGSLADNANYQAAMKSLSGDSLARFFVDAKSFVSDTIDSLNQMMAAFPTGASAMPTFALATSDLPAWLAGSVRAESGQMVVNVTMPRTAADNLGLGNHASRLASLLPGTTVAVAEAHSVGKVITAQMAKVDATAGATAAALAQIKDVLSKIGGADWIGDGVAVVTKDGSTIGGGLVVEAADAATASTKEANITNLATLASAMYHVTSTDETYKGVTITLINIPADVTGGIPLSIAVAAKDNLIVAGYTDAFVKAVIDTSSSTSLASQSDYSKLMGLVGSSNEDSFYVNVPAVEDQIGRQFAPSRWTADYKPYFDHVGGIAGAVIDGDTVILRFVISAR
jgi:Protein of unknown function (DUF3352)